MQRPPPLITAFMSPDECQQFRRAWVAYVSSAMCAALPPTTLLDADAPADAVLIAEELLCNESSTGCLAEFRTTYRFAGFVSAITPLGGSYWVPVPDDDNIPDTRR